MLELKLLPNKREMSPTRDTPIKKLKSEIKENITEAKREITERDVVVSKKIEITKEKQINDRASVAKNDRIQRRLSQLFDDESNTPDATGHKENQYDVKSIVNKMKPKRILSPIRDDPAVTTKGVRKKLEASRRLSQQEERKRKDKKQQWQDGEFLATLLRAAASKQEQQGEKKENRAVVDHKKQQQQDEKDGEILARLLIDFDQEKYVKPGASMPFVFDVCK